MANYTVTFPTGSPAWNLYQRLKQGGVGDADIDTGYPEIDYAKKTRKTVHQGDHKIDETEVLNYALEHYERFQLAIKETMGYDVPWSLDDLNPATDFDAKIRGKVGGAIAAFNKILVAQGLKEGTARYKELLAVALYAFTVSNASSIPIGLRSDLEKEKLNGVLYYLASHGGGLGLSGMDNDCPIEATALGALAKACGACTEESKVLYAVFRAAGLQPKILHVIPDYKDQVPEGTFHASVSLNLGGKTRIFDPALKNENAAPLYKAQKFLWWYEETGAEVLAGHFSNLGAGYLNIGEVARAIATIKIALKIDPGSYEAHLDLGNAYGLKGDFDKAIAEHKIALRINPTLDCAHHNMGIAYDKKGEPKLAMAEYKAALRINPDNAHVHSSLGALYAQNNDWDRAIAEFNIALKSDPKFADAQYNLGYTYALKGDFDRAIAELKIAVKLNPLSAKIHRALGVVYEHKGELDGAIGEMGATVKLDPGDAEAHYFLGCYLAQKGIKYEKQDNKPEALRMFERARQEGNKAKSLGFSVPDEYFNGLKITDERAPATEDRPAPALSPVDQFIRSGDEYYTRNELAKALAAYQQAAKANPQSATAINGIWNTYKALGDKVKAKQACEEYKKVSHDRKMACETAED
jgi:tetratricopeptide (TPR) repeat protein